MSISDEKEVAFHDTPEIVYSFYMIERNGRVQPGDRRAVREGTQERSTSY